MHRENPNDLFIGGKVDEKPVFASINIRPEDLEEKRDICIKSVYERIHERKKYKNADIEIVTGTMKEWDEEWDEQTAS